MSWHIRCRWDSSIPNIVLTTVFWHYMSRAVVDVDTPLDTHYWRYHFKILAQNKKKHVSQTSKVTQQTCATYSTSQPSISSSALNPKNLPSSLPLHTQDFASYLTEFYCIQNVVAKFYSKFTKSILARNCISIREASMQY